MQKTSKTKIIMAGTAIAILTGLGIAASTTPKPAKETTAREALKALAGTWAGNSTVYLSPGLPPTVDKATYHSESLGGYWVSMRLEMTYLGEPYSEVLMLGIDGQAVTGIFFSSNDPTPRVATGSYNTRSGIWELFHDTLNPAGTLVAAKTSLSANRSQKTLALERVHLLDNGFEALALEVHGSLRGR